MRVCACVCVCACVTVCIVPLMGLLTGLGYLEGFDINFYFFIVRSTF